MPDKPPLGADSPMHAKAEPQTMTLNGTKWTFTPVPLGRIASQIESRVRSWAIETYMRGAIAGGVGEDERNRYMRRLTFGPLGERPPDEELAGKTPDEVRQAQESASEDAVTQWLASPAGVEYMVWKALQPHYPKLCEGELPFSMDEKRQFYERILTASGWIIPDAEEETGTDPLAENATSSEASPAVSPPATTGD